MPWSSMPAGTETVFKRLKESAREMRTVRYMDLAEEAGLAAVGLGQPLGYIRDEVCRAHGLPWLTSIAVAKNGVPGPGFFVGTDLTLGEDFEVWWRAMVLQVFATDWSSIELPSSR